MYEVLEDHVKQRLTDPATMAEALKTMREHGFDETEALVQLLRMFHLDLDEFAAAVKAA